MDTTFFFSRSLTSLLGGIPASVRHPNRPGLGKAAEPQVTSS